MVFGLLCLKSLASKHGKISAFYEERSHLGTSRNPRARVVDPGSGEKQARIMVLDFRLASCLQTDEGLVGENNKEIDLCKDYRRHKRAAVELLCELVATHRLPGRLFTLEYISFSFDVIIIFPLASTSKRTCSQHPFANGLSYLHSPLR